MNNSTVTMRAAKRALRIAGQENRDQPCTVTYTAWVLAMRVVSDLEHYAWAAKEASRKEA